MACINSGAEEYFVKPVTRKEVQNIWTHVMKRLAAQAQAAHAGHHMPPGGGHNGRQVRV